MASVHTRLANSTANLDISKSTLQSRKKEIHNESDNMGQVNPDIFKSSDTAKSCLVSYEQ